MFIDYSQQQSNSQRLYDNTNTEIWGAYHLHRKSGNFGLKSKWYVPFRLERSGKIGRSFEPIHFSRSFRFSRLVREPFQLPALFNIFHTRQNKMAGNEGNKGEFKNCQITSLKSILLRIILIPLQLKYLLGLKSTLFAKNHKMSNESFRVPPSAVLKFSLNPGGFYRPIPIPTFRSLSLIASH